MTEITRYAALNVCCTLIDAHIRAQSWNQTKLIPIEECEKANEFMSRVEKVIKEMMLENRPDEKMREEAGHHEVGSSKGKDAKHDAGKVGHADGGQSQASQPALPASGFSGGHLGHDHQPHAPEWIPDHEVKGTNGATVPAKIGQDGQVRMI